MTNEEYKELNGYLNDIFLKLEQKDYFFIGNIEIFQYLSNRYCEVIEKYDLPKVKNDKYLSFDEVYKLAREVIESINPNYLETFDKLIETGELDFDYEDNYEESNMYFEMNKERKLKLINIKRTYNYEEVKILVHEFIHYTHTDIDTIKKHVLTEALAISGELYAEDYLIDKGINRDEVNSTNRLQSTYERCCEFSWIMDALIVYKNIGNLDSTSSDFAREYIMDIENEELESQYKNLLKTIRNYDNKEEIYKFVENYYRYLFGTLIGFYTKNHIDKKDFSYLNDHINDDNELFVIDILQKIGIDLEDDEVIDEIYNDIGNYISNLNYKVIK